MKNDLCNLLYDALCIIYKVSAILSELNSCANDVYNSNCNNPSTAYCDCCLQLNTYIDLVKGLVPELSSLRFDSRMAKLYSNGVDLHVEHLIKKSGSGYHREIQQTVWDLLLVYCTKREVSTLEVGPRLWIREGYINLIKNSGFVNNEGHINTVVSENKHAVLQVSNGLETREFLLKFIKSRAVGILGF